jgi:hypothetical protein
MPYFSKDRIAAIVKAGKDRTMPAFPVNPHEKLNQIRANASPPKLPGYEFRKNPEPGSGANTIAVFTRQGVALTAPHIDAMLEVLNESLLGQDIAILTDDKLLQAPEI